MNIRLTPLLLADFHLGVNRAASVSPLLAPPNSVVHSLNVNYDTTIGSAVVRSGTTLLGAQVSANNSPLGLAEFVGPYGTPNLLLSVFDNGANAPLYVYNGSWAASSLVLSRLAGSLPAFCTFATLGGYEFVANGVDSMQSSTDGITWGSTNCITTDGVIPTILFQTQSLMLATGDAAAGSTHSRCRVFFSSIVDNGVITWNTNPVTGDWIDIDPDNGGFNTGFAETSSVTLAFTNKAFYILDAINNTVIPRAVCNVGAVSPRAITNCQGVIYYFSGIDIRRTNGGFPETITRLGCQDFINAIPQANWKYVCIGQDGFNVYASIGDITLYPNQSNQVTYTNLVLKFSTRDESWSIHSYGQEHHFYANYTTSVGRTMVEADTAGNVQTMNSGLTDNTVPLFYELVTQDLDFGNRSHVKKITEDMAVFTLNGQNSSLQVSSEYGDFVQIPVQLNDGCTVLKQQNIQGRWLNFRWYGNTSGNPPTLLGLYFEKITDIGIV